MMNHSMSEDEEEAEEIVEQFLEDSNNMDFDLDQLDEDNNNNKSNNTNGCLGNYLETIHNNSIFDNLENNKLSLSQEIQEIIDKSFIGTLDEYYDYKVPDKINAYRLDENNFCKNLEIGNNTRANCKINCLSECINSAKNTLNRDYKNLQDAERDLIIMIDEIDKIQSLSSKLEQIYQSFNNIEISTRFRLVTLDAYKEKINDSEFQDKHYIYRYMLSKHRQNIKSLKDLNLLNNKSNCPLCFKNNIDHVILPCGHTFCKICLDKCNLCGVCRGKIEKIQKIFIL